MTLDEHAELYAPTADDAQKGVTDRPPPWAAVAVDGDIDLVTAPDLFARILAAADHGAGVVVDLGHADFVDTSAVDVLEQAWTRLDADGHGLLVRRPPRLLTMMLEVFGLSHLIEDPSAASSHLDC